MCLNCWPLRRVQDPGVRESEEFENPGVRFEASRLGGFEASRLRGFEEQGKSPRVRESESPGVRESEERVSTNLSVDVAGAQEESKIRESEDPGVRGSGSLRIRESGRWWESRIQRI